MSFLSRLFGAKPSSAKPGQSADPGLETGQMDYKGFVIRAIPFKANGQYQTAGVIEKTIDGVVRAQRFVRADRSTAVEEATALALAKGQLMIDQQGDALFG